MIPKDYKRTAEQHEQLFRNILGDMKQRCVICPKDFNPDEPIDKIIEKYSTGNRYGRFTICDFAVGPNVGGLVELAEKEALIDVEDIACLSGHGYSLVYKIQEDKSVKFNRKGFVRMS
ncbi:MAG: hypothetical protein Q8N63_01695 [Nanoarchaeota archaeon]|nr:hypothetical protein [Nanoarchaeota archaeon]